MNRINDELKQKSMIASGEWFFNQLFNPNPDDDTPIGPWSPYIRKALSELAHLSNLHSRAKQGFGRFGFQQYSVSYLNPQPLPPAEAFIYLLTGLIIERAQLMMDLAPVREDGEQRSIIIVSGLVSDYVDALCPIVPTLKLPAILVWHEKVPHPEYIFELVIAGAQFNEAARYTTNSGLKDLFINAADKLTKTGLDRL